LEFTNEKRIEHAKSYSEFLDQKKFELPVTLPGYKHVFHLYVVRVEDRQKFLSELPNANIFPGVHYEWPVHLNDAYQAKIGRVSDSLKYTEMAAKQVLSLPMYPELLEQDIQYISEVMNNV